MEGGAVAYSGGYALLCELWEDDGHQCVADEGSLSISEVCEVRGIWDDVDEQLQGGDIFGEYLRGG